jgi:uncharacterized protein YprB with RNaseH-like and TPR domain
MLEQIKNLKAIDRILSNEQTFDKLEEKANYYLLARSKDTESKIRNIIKNQNDIINMFSLLKGIVG